ncbi:hypothetical protein JOD29_003883 [Lysinibacillus composti]|uniref:Uncharacterized protein n=1 Tax=Lysinibacillus composti TaxID=720633 RepID=A0A3N9U4G0_9BACI|nr:hypothetical protein [Lysinibacillus composti]MBM7610591.1 hypothetical protein [Lysinibacillus composti]RQW71518.1 hypothetical protein EBB45_19235 [Lysinibacillus composti]
MQEGKRLRSDRKKDIKPFLTLSTKESIYRLSYITQTPVKDVAATLLTATLINVKILNALSVYFKRDIRINQTLFRGNLSNPTIQKKQAPGTCERISLRVTKRVYDILSALAYALDCSKARACALLLENSMTDFEIVNEYLKNYLEQGLDKRRMAEVNKLMSFINKEFSEKDYSYMHLLSHMVDEVNTPISSTKEIVDEFIIHHWRKD